MKKTRSRKSRDTVPLMGYILYISNCTLLCISIDVHNKGTAKNLYIVSSTVHIINPFMFIRGLSCPSSVQTSITHHCVKLAIPGFPYNLLSVYCCDMGFFKKKSLGQVLAGFRLQSAFTAFRSLLPSAYYSAE